MVFTPANLSIRDREFLSYDSAPTGSQVRVLTSITGSIVIGSVSANVDSVYIQSGAEIFVALSGTQDQTTPVGVSGIVTVSGTIATINSIAVSGTSFANTIQETDPWITLGSTRFIPGDDVPVVGSEVARFA